MDTDVTQEVRAGRKKKIIGVTVACICLLAIVIMLLRFTIKSTIRKSAITTGIVEKGNIENTINAVGEILPEFEQTITSPINASVQKVILDAGRAVKAGQSVLELDKSASEIDYEKLRFQLSSKQNDIKKLQLQLNKSFYDVKSSNDIKQLRINSLEAEVENTKRLFKAGGGTREDIEKAELELRVAKLEKQQLENEIKSKQQTMQVEMKEAEIAASIQAADLHELQRKLKLADITAAREGVVTWVNKNIGSAVHAGDALARIADLSSFKVQGNISDNYMDQLRRGMPVIVRINEVQLRGTVSNIQPSIQNGMVSFDIQLDERNNKQLRPNLKVDVFLVTDSRTNIVRVANGAAFKGVSPLDLFVVREGKAERKTVHTGLSNFDFIEIKDKLVPGDVIITSDMSDYKHTDKITVTD